MQPIQPTRFMRKPFVVYGYQVTLENMEAVARWCEGQVVTSENRPFIRVNVIRPVNKRQTEAYVGNWVLVSVQNGQKSYKVYTQDWIDRQFIPFDDESMDAGLDFDTRTGTTREIDANVLNNSRPIPGQRDVPAPPVTFRQQGGRHYQ